VPAIPARPRRVSRKLSGKDATDARSILQQMVQLDTMEYGSLQTEHRSAAGGGKALLLQASGMLLIILVCWNIQQ